MPCTTAREPASAREVEIALRDGRSLRLRSARADDEPRVRTFLSHLDGDDRVLRFFTAGIDLGHGCAVRTGPDEAEVAFVVDPALRGEGVATAMLALLADAARAAEIAELECNPVIVDAHGAAAVDMIAVVTTRWPLGTPRCATTSDRPGAAPGRRRPPRDAAGRRAR